MNLQKVYPGLHALNDITFSVPKNSVFGLLGPNGAGKSTTFNIITSLIQRSMG
jgi:branched-chain amino acid transport system ATP-binding protein